MVSTRPLTRDPWDCCGNVTVGGVERVRFLPGTKFLFGILFIFYVLNDRIYEKLRSDRRVSKNKNNNRVKIRFLKKKFD